MSTLAIDFDGVIHAYSKGWQDGSIYDPPMPGAFDALRELRKRYELVIFTTRASKLRGMTEVREWFRKHGVPDLAELKVTDHKPLCVALIDDRAIRFESWPQATHDIERLIGSYHAQ